MTDNIGNIGALLYLVDIRFPYEPSHEPILRSGSTGLRGEPLVPRERTLIGQRRDLIDDCAHSLNFGRCVAEIAGKAWFEVLSPRGGEICTQFLNKFALSGINRPTRFVGHDVRGNNSLENRNFGTLLGELTSRDPGDLMIERIEANAESGSDGGSGLGILTLMNDYSAEMGWTFGDKGAGDTLDVTTRVRLPLD